MKLKLVTVEMLQNDHYWTIYWKNYWILNSQKLTILTNVVIKQQKYIKHIWDSKDLQTVKLIHWNSLILL